MARRHKSSIRTHRWTTWALAVAALLTLGAAAAAQETVTIWVPGGGLNVYGVYAQTAAKFVEKHGYKAEIVPVQGDYYEMLDKVLVSELGGVSVDLILTVDYTGAEYVGADLYTNLMPFVERDGFDLGLFPEVAVDVFSVSADRYLYALPVGLGTSALFYIPDKFAAAGLVPPPQDWHSPAWTWTEFVDTSRKLKVDRDGDGVFEELALARWLWPITPLLWGTDLTDATGARSNLADPTVLAALEQALALTTQHQVVYGVGVPTTGGGDWGAFYGNRAAMMPAWDESAEAMYQNLRSELQVGVYPMGTTRRTRLSVFGFAIGSTSRNKEAVWEILKDMATDREGAIDTLQRGGRIPAYGEAIMDSLAYFSEAFPGLNAYVFVQPMVDPSLQALQPWRYNANGREVERLFNQAWSQAVRGEQSLTNAFLEIHPRVDQLLQGGYVGILD